jgi:hypothetical protein
MSYLAKLQLVALKRRDALPPLEHRRARLIARLSEQLALAEAQAQGKRLIVSKQAWTRDDDGNRQRVQVDRVVRPWWWSEGTGLVLVVRYGARPLELTAGKRAIAIAHAPMLPGALNTLIAAVKAGELDGAMAAAVEASKLKRAGR